MKREKLVALVAVVALLASMLGGCGGGATQTDGNADSKDGITLNMIESLTSPDRTKVIRDLLDKFEAENPGIKVELISPPLNNADDKIAQMLMQKQPLDVLEVRDHTAKQFINNDFIQPMDSYLDQWSGKDTLVQVAKDDIYRIGGKAYLIPYGFYQRVLYYNKTVFDEKGLQPPTTFEELHNVGAQLVDPAAGKYGYSFRGGAGGQWYADMQIQAYVAGEIEENEAYFLKDGSTIFAAPEAVDALNDYIALYKDASPPDSLTWSYTEMVEGFVSGVTAMLIQDPEVIAACTDGMEEGTWATAPLPVGPSGKSYGPMGYGGWGMTSYTKHPDEAWKLISFLCSEENNLTFCKENSLLPIHTTAEQDPFFGEGPYKPYSEMAKQPDKWVCAIAPQQYPGWGEYIKRANDDIQKLLTDAMTVEDVLAGWDAFWTEQRANAQS